jgi:glyoxylase-like metal-dependent hydrolase (beta-lactamase superfamily II)
VLDVPGKPRAVHTPGHTDGHCALLFESRGALFVGDELCTWNPLTGTRGPRLMPKVFDVSYAQCVESLARIEPLDAALILPGHGDPWSGTPADAVARAREAAS